MGRPKGSGKPLTERFWPKVAVRDQDECWEWQASRSPEGYGRLSPGNHGRAPLYAHRVSWELHFGVIPEGFGVFHSCDNPPCVNPAHLFCGPPTLNAQDMMSKGRGNGQFVKGQISLVRPKKYERYSGDRGLIQLSCDGCGKEIWQRRDHAARSTRHYCGAGCQNRERNVSSNPL